MIDIYQKLREQLDQYGSGYPKTESGVEIKLLKKLFDEQAAELYLNLSLMLEDADSVASRLGRDPVEVAQKLEDMAKKGLLFRQRKDSVPRYACAPYVIGWFEYQVGDMDTEFAKLSEELFLEGVLPNIKDTVVPLRTIPVGKSIDVQHNVAHYDDARQIIKSKKKIALAECICRKQQNMIGKGCGKPLEVCLMFGSHADYYVENKLGRFIDQEEAIRVLDQCEEAGLVNQPANMINPGGMCNCCGDCCGILRGLNLMSKPAQMVFNKYYATIDEEACIACDACGDRCQMGAIDFEEEEYAVIIEDRCIGCGLCVTTCPTEAIQMILKPESEHVNPPETGGALAAMSAEKRGTSLIPLSL